MDNHYAGMDTVGVVLRLERGSVFDGEGFRTVVFLKGCHMSCKWCSTPESQNFEIERTLDGKTVYGKAMTVEDVMKEVRKDTLFYFHSGGGLTMSGGEVMAQPEFTKAVLRQSQREGINTAIETAFYAKWEICKSVIEYVDTAYIDLKAVDPDIHKANCGVDNKSILENLLHTNEVDLPLKIVIRTPVVPGVNDNDEELTRIASFVTRLDKVDHMQLLPYHQLGTTTYEKLGRFYMLKDVEPPTDEQMDHYRDVVSRTFPNVI
jgi:pyruvate formate lyase activating enzyme